MDDFDEQRPRTRSLGVDPVGRRNLRRRGACRALVAGVDFREGCPFLDGVAALAQAPDADGVVDRVVLRRAACAEPKGREADRAGAELRDVPVARSRDFSF